jgi:hypothetical protein
MTNKNIAQILTYCGSLPFVFLTILNLFHKQYFFNIEVQKILIGYCVVISTFISGVHFCFCLKGEGSKIKNSILIFSNFITLIAFACLFLNNINASLIILILCYLINLLIDFIFYRNSLIENWFFYLRLKITIIVLFLLFLNFWHIF